MLVDARWQATPTHSRLPLSEAEVPRTGTRVDVAGETRPTVLLLILMARSNRVCVAIQAGVSYRVRVAREAVGAEGRVVPQQWLLHTTAPGIPADDRRRLDFVLYGAARRCAAMSRSCHPCARTGCRSREVAIVTARQSKSRGAGNSHGTLSMLGPDRKGSWCWHLRSAGVGAARPTISCVASFACGPCELPPCCAQLLPQAGSAAGGGS